MSRPQFVRRVADYECSICKDMLLEAVAPECGHRFCLKCMDSYLDEFGSSPASCPSKDESCPKIVDKVVFPDFAARREMLSLLVYCSFKERGCSVEVEQKSLTKHLENCPYRNNIQCVYARDGCEFKGTQEEFDEHLESQKYVHDQASRTTDLASKVEKMGTALDQIKSQLSDPETRGMASELNFSEKRVRTEISRIMTSLGIGTYYGSLMWRIDDYLQLKRDAIQGTNYSVYSSPFYSHQFGYKLTARFYPDGDGAAKGTHASLFIVVLKGEYDAVLPWPLNKQVHFKLMSQEPSVDPRIVSFNTDSASSSYQRPTTDMNKASGMPQFVRQHVIESRGYLKDDTVFIQITIE